MDDNKLIGELLIKDRVITQDQLDHALAAQKKYGGLLEMILVKQGVLSAQNLTKYLKIIEEKNKISGNQNQSTPKLRLGEILIQNNEITPQQLKQALEYQKEKGVKIGIALVELELIERSTLVRYLTKQSQMVIDTANLFNYEAGNIVDEAEKK
jgi:type IV pilus assembly protein PilB